jgi:hypothetical protein
MSVVVSIVISSLYFVVYPQSMSVSDSSVDRALRILHRAFDLALRSSLSLEPFVAGQISYSLLDLAFAFVDDLAHCLPPVVNLKGSLRYHPGASAVATDIGRQAIFIAKTDTNENI